MPLLAGGVLIRPFQISPFQISPGQISPGQISPAQISPVHISPVQISPVQISPGQISPGQDARAVLAVACLFLILCTGGQRWISTLTPLLQRYNPKPQP